VTPFAPRAYTLVAILACVAGAATVWLFRGDVRLPGSAPEAPAIRNAPSGGGPAAYAATITRRVEGEGETATMVMRFARDGELTRDEWSENGKRYAAISRPDRGVAWLVDLDRSVYVERPLGATDEDDAEDGDPLAGADVEQLVASGPAATVARRLAGNERVDGYACTVYASTIESPGGGVSEARVWEADDLEGLALRSETIGPNGARVTTNVENVDLRPDPSEFELPTGAQRVEAL
jgi:hypothetical protein